MCVCMRACVRVAHVCCILHACVCRMSFEGRVVCCMLSPTDVGCQLRPTVKRFIEYYGTLYEQKKLDPILTPEIALGSVQVCVRVRACAFAGMYACAYACLRLCMPAPRTAFCVRAFLCVSLFMCACACLSS